MSAAGNKRFAIMGAGLGGALMACYLGRKGYRVDVYEKRGDLRAGNIAGGRSINLALSHRGIVALERVGLAKQVLDTAVPMPGRMIHGVDGSLHFQRYGRDDSQAINSVSRGGLNCMLLDAAERHENVRLHFHHKCESVDLDAGRVLLHDTNKDAAVEVSEAVIIGADGAFSAVRRAMQKRDRFNYDQSYLEHGYKELTIPAAEDGGFRIEKHALHIWPRASFMMIALPNEDGSFTVTVFWPYEGPNSFAAIRSRDDVIPFFQRHFPDAVPHMPSLVNDYFDNPIGSMVTIRCGPWFVGDRAVLLGDACHAVVPFMGQGMNAAFEDVLVLDECLDAHADDLETAFARYYRERKANCDTLADMALHNFIEMRDHTGSNLFLLKKKKEQVLHKLLPGWYVPFYALATFTRTPYVEAKERAKRQDRVVRVVGIVLLVIILVLLGAWIW